MHDNQDPESGAEAQQDEPLVLVRMVGVVNQQRQVVRKYRFGLFEGHPVLPGVGACLGRIPLKPDVTRRIYIVCTMY